MRSLIAILVLTSLCFSAVVSGNATGSIGTNVEAVTMTDATAQSADTIASGGVNYYRPYKMYNIETGKQYSYVALFCAHDFIGAATDSVAISYQFLHDSTTGDTSSTWTSWDSVSTGGLYVSPIDASAQVVGGLFIKVENFDADQCELSGPSKLLFK